MAVAWTAAVGRKFHRFSYWQGRLTRCVSFLAVEITVAMIQRGRRTAERFIDCQNVSDEGCRFTALVGKPCHPFHNRVVLILRALNTEVQAGRSVIPFKNCFADIRVDAASA